MNESTNSQVTTGSLFYIQVLYTLSYNLKPSNVLSHQSHMESVSSVPFLAGYCVKNFCYILNHHDLLQESGGLILRVHNSHKRCFCCFLIAVASCMHVPLVKEIKEAYRHLVRMRTITAYQSPYYVKPLSKD
jgi:hypothetical protein